MYIPSLNCVSICCSAELLDIESRTGPCGRRLKALICRRVAFQCKGGVVQVSLHLHAPEVVVHPSANEIKKALARTARSLVESAKSFKRWMDGTCIESPDLPGTLSPLLYGHTPLEVLPAPDLASRSASPVLATPQVPVCCAAGLQTSRLPMPCSVHMQSQAQQSHKCCSTLWAKRPVHVHRPH